MSDGKSHSFRYGIMKDFNVSIPSCTGKLGWRRSPSAAPRAAGGGASPGIRGPGGGRVGWARASTAPEPSLGLVSHVNFECLVSGLLQYCERGGVLVIAGHSGNPPSFDLKYRDRAARVGRMAATSCREKALVAGISGVVAVAGIIIFCCDAVCSVVLLEVEQPACTKGIMTMELE
jgi:hypothetical protein